jgi:hypothetical protein
MVISLISVSMAIFVSISFAELEDSSGGHSGVVAIDTSFAFTVWTLLVYESC